MALVSPKAGLSPCNAIFIALIVAALLLFVAGRFVTSQFAHILKLPIRCSVH